ncbi:MAG: hypothetical protein HOP29_08970 [Phycisphaerales bacterium]|nr:hypothetical protein [Phycisphaerales bacterium]
MKPWIIFVVLTIVCWGAYVPTLHHGQLAFGSRNSALRAFLFVGLAYFLASVGALAYLIATKSEPLEMTRKGMSVSTIAGILGAIGALGIVFAIKNGGKPLAVAPLVFAGAPIMNTMVSMIWDKPGKPPAVWFYVGILLAGMGAALVLRFKPA